MEPRKTRIPAEAVDLYTRYIHGEVSRRDFFGGVSRSVRRHQPPQFLEPGSKVTGTHTGLPGDKSLTFMNFRELKRGMPQALVRDVPQRRGTISVHRH